MLGQTLLMFLALPLICISLHEEGVPEAPGRPLSLAFTSRSVNLSWAPPFNADQVPVTHYVIQVRAGEETPWSEATEVETPHNLTLFQVRDLNPFTTYSFRVTAWNSKGKSVPSESSFYMFTLREVPSGKPTITAAHNTSSTSIQLIWRPPPKQSINGEFLGYEISHRPRNDNATGSILTVQQKIKDPEVTQFTIQDLQPFTQYLVSLRVINPAGLGPETKVVVMTDEGVPSQPLKVVFKEVTNSSVAVHWQEPTEPNGIVAGYRIYYMHDNFTDVQTVRSTNPTMFYTLTGLKSYTRYKIWVKAFTFKNEGQSSDPIEVLTDVTGPGAPLFRNVSCVNDVTLSLEWSMPMTYDRSVDYFIVHYRIMRPETVGSIRKYQRDQQLQMRSRSQEAVENFAETIIVNDVMQLNSQRFEYSLTNLSTGAVYEIRLGAATKSIYSKNLVYRGQFSSIRSMRLVSNCIYYHTETAIGDPSSMNADLNEREVLGNDYREQQVGIVIGLTATLGCIFLIALALLVWRRCFGESYYFLAESPSSLACTATTPDVANHGNPMTTILPKSHPGVPIHLFTRHVLERHASDNEGFRRSFEHIETLSPVSSKENLASLLPHNVEKNRYKNVLAYDHSRVRLRCNSREHEDYINANFIDGFHRARAYIATQGPLPSTFTDFWQMVWEQNTHVIVMITNFIEGGKQKCDQYWPPNQGLLAIYGRIQVSMVCLDAQDAFTLRVLRLKLLRVENEKLVDDEDCPERDVLHFHYTAWPDHGTPETAGQLLAFIQKSSQSNRDTDGPIVVHCSAGVGRTGAYIVIDAMLRQMLSIGKLDIDGYLAYIRSQRNFLIQTVEQYIFVHDVLLEAVSRRMVVDPPPELFSPSASVSVAAVTTTLANTSVTSHGTSTH